MCRWFRLYKEQWAGFWVLGIVLFALQEVPYMVMPFVELESNPIMDMQESSLLLNILEKVSGTLCIVVMTFVVREDVPLFRIGDGICKVGFFSAAAVLLLNDIGWGLYFRGYQSLGVMLFFLVVLPPLYYLCIGVWRRNPALVMAGSVFEMVHVLHVYGNLTM